LNEYHTRLIADVVTGAVDVREAAQALPGDQVISGSDDQIMEEEAVEPELNEQAE
jgi:type I restriction enzyme S subunit